MSCHRCHFCNLWSERVNKMCGGCKRVWYCGEACQTRDWNVHERECTTEEAPALRPTEGFMDTLYGKATSVTSKGPDEIISTELSALADEKVSDKKKMGGVDASVILSTPMARAKKMPMAMQFFLTLANKLSSGVGSQYAIARKKKFHISVSIPRKFSPETFEEAIMQINSMLADSEEMQQIASVVAQQCYNKTNNIEGLKTVADAIRMDIQGSAPTEPERPVGEITVE